MSRLNNSPKLFQSYLVLNDAQVKKLPSTKFELIPAPGQGLVLVPIISKLIAQFDWKADYAGLTAGSGTVFELLLDGWSGSIDWRIAPDTDSLSNFLAWGAPVVWTAVEFEPSSSSGALNNIFEQMENAPLTLRIRNSGSTTDLTGGHAQNKLSFTIPYYIYDTASHLYLA